MAKEDSFWTDQVFEYVYSGHLNEDNVIRFLSENPLKPGFFVEMLEYVSHEASEVEISRAKHLLGIILKNARPSSELIVYLLSTPASHIVSIELVFHAFLVLLELDKCVLQYEWALNRSFTLIMDYLENPDIQDTRMANLAIGFYRKVWNIFSTCSSKSKYLFIIVCIGFLLVADGPNGIQKGFLQLLDEIVMNPMFYVLDKKFVAKWEKTRDPSVPAALGIHFIHWSKLNGRQIYSPDYFFIQALPLAKSLFESQFDDEIAKGLEIIEFSLLGVSTLKKNQLVPVLPVLKILTRLMVYNQNIELRKKALKVFEGILKSYNETAQYLLLMKLHKSAVNCSQLHVYLISKIKKDMAEQPSEKWKGKKTADLLELYCFKTNYSGKSEKAVTVEPVMSSLNLLLYLLNLNKKASLEMDYLFKTAREVFVPWCCSFVQKLLKENSEHINKIKNKEIKPDAILNMQLPNVPKNPTDEEMQQNLLCDRYKIEMAQMIIDQVMEFFEANSS